MFGIPFHVLVVHFPIALATAALCYDFSGFYYGISGSYRIGSGLGRWAALTAILAVATGFNLAGMSGLGSRGGVTGHAGFAIVTTIVLVVLMFVRYSAEAREESVEKTFPGVWLAVEFLAVILASVTVIIGHRL